jgi:hypothetical protein
MPILTIERGRKGTLPQPISSFAKSSFPTKFSSTDSALTNPMRNGISGKFVSDAANLLKRRLHRHFGITSILTAIRPEQLSNSCISALQGVIETTWAGTEVPAPLG